MTDGDEDDALLWRNSWMSGLPENRQVYEARGPPPECNTVQYSAMQCNTVQYSGIQCNLVQYSAEQKQGGVLGLSER